METIIQVLKYSLVGIGNTLITWVVIWLLNDILGFSYIIANPIGYVAGLINSFIWNKNWTFKSTQKVSSSVIRFGVVWLICYLLQLWLVMYLREILTMEDKYITIIGMFFFTVINFILNKFYTFKT